LRVPGQVGLYSETLSQKKKNKTEKREKMGFGFCALQDTLSTSGGCAFSEPDL
jgi:hypothetical protein